MDMPDSPGYVWEKMYVAVGCMCGKSSLAERLANATVAALLRLKDDDLPPGDLREDLKFVLKWTKDNVMNAEVIKLPDDIEHKLLVEKMLHILLETNDH
jgi:hypothetical protein